KTLTPTTCLADVAAIVGKGWPSTQPSTTPSIWTIQVAPEVPEASNICLLLCNGILAAALLIRCMDLGRKELFLNVCLYLHETRLCSESATKIS
ncbi:unnamed protein product, partial [Staurois parvus]